MECQVLKIEELKPHPKNPRLVMREDVIGGIVAGLDNGFHPSHALQVWPSNGFYYILSGHHRLDAAKRKGLVELPCWVREDLDEDGAYMLLATDNNQGELSPLEIGMHALNYIGVESGGRGQKGGLSEYARQIGKAKSTVSGWKSGARVLKNCSVDRTVLITKAEHLSAIHSLPESLWQSAVELMLKKEWSASETQKQVQSAKEGQTEKQISTILHGKTTKRELDRIAELKDKVAQSLVYGDIAEIWLAWFDEEDPIDVKQVQAKRIELEDLEAERRHQEQEVEVSKLPNFVLADPPWRYDFSNTDNRQIENQYPSATIPEIISHRPETQPDCILLMWATAPKLVEALEVMEGWGFKYKTHAIWDKEKIGMGYWFRGQHELLLVGTKGDVSPPEPEDRVSSVFREKRGEHSEKPESVYAWVESAFRHSIKLEMYCRNKRPGWVAWGNES